jgi:hypothetical protein
MNWTQKRNAVKAEKPQIRLGGMNATSLTSLYHSAVVGILQPSKSIPNTVQ